MESKDFALRNPEQWRYNKQEIYFILQVLREYKEAIRDVYTFQ